MQISAPTTRRITLLAATFSVLLAALPQAASAGALFPDSAQSPVAEKVNLLYIIIFVVGIAAIFAVVGSVVRATRSAGADESAQAESSTKSIVIGASVLAVVFAIVGTVAYSDVSGAKPSSSGVGSDFKAPAYTDKTLKVAHDIKPPKGPAMSVHVNGQQYMWRYTYPGFKGKTWDTYNFHTLVVPVGVTVMLDVTTSDVEHGWWVPQLGGTIGALPGYINKGWIRVDKAGTYTGAGTVLNGSNYASQTTEVVAVPPAEFLAWIKGKQLQIDAAMTALGLERASGEEAALITGGKAGAVGMTKAK